VTVAFDLLSRKLAHCMLVTHVLRNVRTNFSLSRLFLLNLQVLVGQADGQTDGRTDEQNL